MEKTLQQEIDEAEFSLLEIWFIVKMTGNLEDIRYLIECTEKYDSLLKEKENFEKQIEGETEL